jgi:hypothetical protein
MHTDLDTLCTTVYCRADDLLPEKPGNARRRVTDAEVAALCVAQAMAACVALNHRLGRRSRALVDYVA